VVVAILGGGGIWSGGKIQRGGKPRLALGAPAHDGAVTGAAHRLAGAVLDVAVFQRAGLVAGAGRVGVELYGAFAAGDAHREHRGTFPAFRGRAGGRGLALLQGGAGGEVGPHPDGDPVVQVGGVGEGDVQGDYRRLGIGAAIQGLAPRPVAQQGDDRQCLNLVVVLRR